MINDKTLKFIKNFSNKFDNFTYDDTKYVSLNKYLLVSCPIHGNIKVLPKIILKSLHPCKKCKTDEIRRRFYMKCNRIHNNLYTYLDDYKTDKCKFTIICEKHGEFKQLPNNHINQEQGCLKCKTEDSRLSYTEFLSRSNIVHNKKYEYIPNIENFKSNMKIDIKCPIHGWYKQVANDHCNTERGCTFCKESKGEKEISRYLINNNIDFIREYKFSDCRNVRCLPFDFYLQKLNVCIEFNGKQHYKPLEFFGGVKRYEEQIINDNIKVMYCNRNKIKLIIIDVISIIEDKLNKLIK